MDSTISYLSALLGLDRSPVISMIALLLLTFCLWNLWVYLRSPLRRYPGPVLARWTNLWRLYQMWRGSSHLTFYALHQKYGPIVRIGPDLLDLDMPDLINTIYGTDGEFKKSGFYTITGVKIKGKIVHTLVGEPDKETHARLKRPIAKAFSTNRVLLLEPLIDPVINYLNKRLEEEFIDGANVGRVCDLGAWISHFTWDSIGAFTFSRTYGYLEKGYDFDGTQHANKTMTDYMSSAGQLPIIDSVLTKNPFLYLGPRRFEAAQNIAVQRLMDRRQGKDGEYLKPSQQDFLQSFIEAKQQQPDAMDDLQIVLHLMANLIAGAEPTAIVIRSVFYLALKNRRVWSRLEEEVLATAKTHEIDYQSTPFSIKTARAMPYLEAVIRESMRVEPAVGINLERYVPESGFRLPLPDGDGEHGFLPGGVGIAVGMNPYILYRNRDVWGNDAEVFRPERWLRDVSSGETEDAFQARLRRMNGADLTFSAGSRICLGKSLAMMEVYKTISTLIARYKFELVHPDREWKVISSFFMRQEGLECRLARRTSAST